MACDRVRDQEMTRYLPAHGIICSIYLNVGRDVLSKTEKKIVHSTKYKLVSYHIIV